MEKNKLNKILSIVIPIVVFTTLFLIGTVYDLEISRIFVRNLPIGSYYTSNKVALFAEYFGPLPFYFGGFFGCLMLFVKFNSLEKENKLRYLSYAAIGGAFVFSALCLQQTMKFIFRVHDMEKNLMDIDMLVAYLFFGVACTILGVRGFKKFDVKYADKMLYLGIVCVAAVALYAIVHFSKGPLGRIRYRAMNEIDDFTLYVPWYHINANKELDYTIFTGGKDGLKSFPSGHSFCASMIFLLGCLPFTFNGFNEKKWKIIIHVTCIIYTVTICFLRIVAGAHFLTDVVMGSAIGYFGIRILRYFLLERKKLVD